MAVPPGRVPLHDEQLGGVDVLAGAVRQLARQTTREQGSLALHELSGLPGSFPGALRGNGLVDDLPGALRVLLEEGRQPLSHRLLHHSLDVAVAELGFGLPLELRLGDLH